MVYIMGVWCSGVYEVGIVCVCVHVQCKDGVCVVWWRARVACMWWRMRRACVEW